MDSGSDSATANGTGGPEGNRSPELEQAYDAQGTVEPERFAALMRRYRDESDAAVHDLPGVPGIEYDTRSGERLDLWGAGPDVRGRGPRPAVVFVHGGYWKALSRRDSAFLAGMLDGRGVATVVPDYTLAPAASLEEIVRQVRTAVAWVYRNGPGYGIDPNRITVAGSSAGGHLAVMAMVGGWQAAYGLPDDVVAAGMPISGLYDLRPLLHTSANGWLGLDAARAAALSPLTALREADEAARVAAGTTADAAGGGRLAAGPGDRAPVRSRRCPSVVVAAEHEAAGFREQAREFHAAWAPSTDLLVVPERNHFDVILDLSDPRSAISRALLDLVDRTARRA